MFDEIKKRFPGKAWAYAVMYHGVGIGIWDGSEPVFHESVEFDNDCIMEMRVFDASSELRIICGDGSGNPKYRFISDAENSDCFDRDYICFGTDSKCEAGFTSLSEDRGGVLYFPKEIQLLERAVLWLTIRNYMRYNAVDIDDRAAAKPPLEIYDYRFVGFKMSHMTGDDKKVVTL